MKSIVMSALIVTIAALFAIGSSPLIFAANETSSGTATVTSSSSSSPALILVPVTLSFSPVTETLHTGSPCPANTYCATNKLSIHNSETKAITFTGCQFFVKMSTSSVYSKGTCSLNGSITVAASSKSTIMWGTFASLTTPKGTYNAKVVLTNSVDKSGTGKFNFIVP